MGNSSASIGVIGGSGLYHMPELTDVEEISVYTPFGPPSDSITLGTLAGQRVAFLPRHGRGHRINPTALPVRANIWALKSLGVQHLISVSAVGSLREEIAPRHIVIPDQLFDRTRLRANTFFEEGIVAHVGIADPFCSSVRQVLLEAGRDVSGVQVHDGGTLVVIEGPQFSTKGESRVFRQWGLDIIGMTTLPEARLAREAEMCYGCLALVTDYDVWHHSEEPVTTEMVIQVLTENVAAAQRILKAAIPRLADSHCSDGCGNALATAIATAPDAVSAEVKERLGLLLDKYLG
ncbi:MAG: S-methyl-5'-thioadenosine phosphorylase [Anaerolineae bacterium]|nr:S-methyl-5'-thioadenosine phosphorylase [Anaerolineae bacterium]